MKLKGKKELNKNYLKKTKEISKKNEKMNFLHKCSFEKNFFFIK